MTRRLARIAATYTALHAAHTVADHWVQTDRQARTKGMPGWSGRKACAAHVATYTATGLAAIGALSAVTGWRLGTRRLVAGLAVSAVTHYIADRRTPLLWMADRTGKAGFARMGQPANGDSPCLGTGAYALDQSWHTGWLYVAALIVGGAR